MQKYSSASLILAENNSKTIINSINSKLKYFMKALKILAIIFGVLTVLLTFAPIMRDLSLANEISEFGSMGDSLGLPSAGLLYFALFIAVLVSITSVIGIVFAIKKNPKLKTMALVVFALVVLSIIIHPSFKISLRSASPREIAVFHAIPAILTALFLFLFANKVSKSNQV